MIVHVANLLLVQVNAAGVVKPRTQMTIGEVTTSSTDTRIQPDVDNSNTADYPTLKEYLEAEAASGFKLAHLDQTWCITYDS